MTWILHYCLVGWLVMCDTYEYPTEQACDKALITIERQAKEQNIRYRVLCSLKSQSDKR